MAKTKMNFDQYLKESVEAEFEGQFYVLSGNPGPANAYIVDISGEASSTLDRDGALQDIMLNDMKLLFSDKDDKDISTISIDKKDLEKYISKEDIRKLYSNAERSLEKKVQDNWDELKPRR